MMPVQAQKTKKRERETGKHGTPYPLPVTGGRTLSREKHCQQAAYGLGTFKLRSKPEGLIGHALGLKIDDVNESIKIVKEGLPFPSLQHLGRELEMSNVELALTLGIPSRTLARRQRTGRLASGESERLFRLSALYEKARALFKSHEETIRWFKTPKAAFNNKTPLQFADNELGAREVEDLLGRIEHGVFS